MGGGGGRMGGERSGAGIGGGGESVIINFPKLILMSQRRPLVKL